MTTRAPSRPPRFSIRRSLLLLAAVTPAACGGGGPGATAPAPRAASEEEWRALAVPRPEPVEGAPRVALGKVQILADDPWGSAAVVDPGLGVSELIAAGLLRRRDVRYVERRRFAAAAEAERRGLPRREGAPAPGVSEGPELLVDATWASVGLDSAWIDLRLRDSETGEIVATARRATANDAGPAALARSVVSTMLAALEEEGRLPAWEDPVAAAAPPAYRPTGLSPEAVQAFFRGLAGEERWDWNRAHAGYQEAIDRGGDAFFEARAALARAARLRNGGTLGAG